MTENSTPVETVTLTIDGITTTVPKGSLVIRAAEQIGVQIPRFCDHPLLKPVGACRQCLVEVALPGPNGELRQMQGPPGRMKPQPSCTMVCSDGMEVKTQLTSPAIDKAQQGIMEFLLINHPLDCPVCDKGGECPLQNQAMSNGRGESRFSAQGMVKRTFPKPISISPQILLDRERCIVCQRCTRFADEVAGDPFISLVERGAQQQIGIAENAPFLSYFAGNTIQICPVGALTSEDYRFRSRPFDLVSTPAIAEHDSCGAAIRVDHRRGKVMRRLAGDDPEVNEEWITDKDRFGFHYARTAERLTYPQVRDRVEDGGTGELRPASWIEAFVVAARGLAAAGDSAVLTGGRLTVEDAYAYSKFARVALGTNDIDFRARVHSAEEASFLAAHVAGTRHDAGGVTYSDLESADTVLLVGLEPEDEAGTIFLRLRKAVMDHGTAVISVAPYASRGLGKVNGRLVATAPGDEAAALPGLAGELGATSVILVGERLAASPGAYAAAADLAAASGARLAWVPRRAGDRGAVDAGALPNLLPGSRPVADASARVDVASAWGVDSLPSTPGRDGDAIIAALAAGSLGGLVVAGVDPDDTADPDEFRRALATAGFVVALELCATEVTAEADVVFPAAPVTDKAGTFVTWDGRERAFGAVLENPASLPDLRTLAGIAEEMGRPLGFRTVAEVRSERDQLGEWDGERAAFDAGAPTAAPTPAAGQLRLATWKQLIDLGSLQLGDPYYQATARPSVARLSADDAAAAGVTTGDLATLTGDRGSLTVPVEVTDMVAGTVWVPARSLGRGVLAELASPGSGVTVTRAEAPVPVTDQSDTDVEGAVR